MSERKVLRPDAARGLDVERRGEGGNKTNVILIFKSPSTTTCGPVTFIKSPSAAAVAVAKKRRFTFLLNIL